MRPTWQELLDGIKPSPITTWEQEAMDKLQPGQYDIYWKKIDAFLDEAREVFTRTGISSMLISGDVSVCIYTSQGDLVGTSCGATIHAVVAQSSIKWIIKNYQNDPTVGIYEGDIFYVGDILYGCIHNLDQYLFMPVFNDEKLIAWVGGHVHEPETGGVEPGGMSPAAKSRHYEGMLLPPLKIGVNYRLKSDLMELMTNFISRAPRMQRIDVMARATGADRMRIRIQELAREKGNDFVVGLFRRMIQVAEEGVKSKIKELTDGVYRVAIFDDTVGYAEGLNRAKLSLIKKDDHITFDFTGTSPENEGSYNAMPHIVVGMANISLWGFYFHEIPMSAGAYSSFDWIIPEGSVFNCHPEAASSNSPVLCGLVMSAFPICFSKLCFDSNIKYAVGATHANMGMGIVIAGVNQYGMPFAELLGGPLNSEGGGARYNMDGIDTFGFSWCLAGRAPDVEHDEVENPISIISFRQQKDTGGAGKYRGGCSSQIMLTPHEVPWLAFNSISSGSRVKKTAGLFGGYVGSTQPGIQVTNTNYLEKMASGDRDLPVDIEDLISSRSITGKYSFECNTRATRILQPGDIFCLAGAGGGGYGDVLERDAEAVMDDIKNDLISHWTAQNVYRVAYDSDTLIVDHEETEQLRQAFREERKELGKTYDEFMQEWSELKPPEEALKFYGSWPDAEKVQEIVRI